MCFSRIYFTLHNEKTTEIPNYYGPKKKNLKCHYPFMPKDTFRMLICGSSGSGKTNILLLMLLHPLVYAKNFSSMQKILNRIGIKIWLMCGHQ